MPVPTSLTELQLHRIKFHLDEASDLSGVISVIRDTRVYTLTSIQLRDIVGSNLELLPADQVVIKDGERLCTTESLLGKIERSYNNLDPSVVNESTYVRKAGDIELLSTEYSNRKRIYKDYVSQLASIVGKGGDEDRAGW